jgi:hypothetical protein
METYNEIREHTPAPTVPASVVPAPPPATNGLATRGMVLGIVGLSISWVPFLGFFSLPLGILATVFGGVSFSKASKLGGLNKGQAITAIVTGAIAILVWILFLALFSAVVSSGIDA